MPSFEPTVDVETRIGRLAIVAVAIACAFPSRVTLRLAVWAINRSCWVRIDRGRWAKIEPGFVAVG